MKRKRKLKHYKHVRSIRDELLTCENEGRQIRLVMKLPNTWSIRLRSGSYGDSCEVKLRNGFIIRHTGDDCIVKCGTNAYTHWLRSIP